MNIILIILLGIAGIIILLLLIGLFTKKDYAVEREITINKPAERVFNYIKYLKNQDNYSKWAMMDPGMKKEFRGTDGTVGFVSAWESDNKKVGKGEQQISGIREGERIDMKLHFIKPWEGKADAHMVTEDIGAAQTKVKWGLKSRMNYPMNTMMLFMNMDSMLGKDLEVGLAKLKTLLENKN